VEAMRKKMLVAVLLCLFMLGLPAWACGEAVFSIGSSTYSIDGNYQAMDVAPYIEHGRTYIPIRYAAESVGVASDGIIWNPTTRQVLISKGGRLVQLTVGSTVMTLNGDAIQMDAPPEITGSRVMIPVRFLAQALGIDIEWDPAARTVTVSNPVIPVAAQQGSLTTVPSLSYDSSVQKTSRDFTWKYQGRTFNWHVEVPRELLDWNRMVSQTTDKYYSGRFSQHDLLETMPDNLKTLVLAVSVQERGDLTPWVNEENNSEWAGYLSDRLAECARENGYDYWRTAEFIQSFVGSAIPYHLTDVPELPAQTMIDDGDCKGKSILLAAILKNLSYKVALLEFLPDSGDTGHMAVGVVFDDAQTPRDRKLSYYYRNGVKFYFAETTAPNWKLGDMPDDISARKPAIVYEVN
jgi:hypothetical protein